MWGKRETNDFSVNKINVEQLADIIRESGYKALVDRDSNGVSFIESASHGWRTQVQVRDDQTSFQFQLWLGNNIELNLDHINRFNWKYRIGKAMLSGDGKSICLIMDVDVDGGVSQLYLARRVAAWDVIVGIFSQELAKAEPQRTDSPSHPIP